MLAVVNVVAPVFALIALGYAAVRLRLYPREGVGGLIGFVNTFAAPTLLFRAMLTVDFGAAFIPAIIGPFYLGAVLMMVFGALTARKIFGRSPGESVAVGFAAMFTNTVLVGVPVIQRAYGDAAMPVVFSIIGLHAPVLMTGGMLYMELMRRDGGKVSVALLQGMKTALTNPLLIGIGLGVAGNLAGVRLGGVLDDTTALLASSVMPVALFGLGGALNDYKLADNLSQATIMSGFKLIVHPLIAWIVMVPVLGVDPQIARYGVLLAAMPTGINAYIFSTYYNRSVDVATNTILLSTFASVFTISGWLLVMGA